MTQGEIIIMTFQALLITGLGTMFWRRMDRLEDRMDAGFARVDAQFDQIVGTMDSRFAQTNNTMDSRFAQVDDRFAQMDSRFDQLRSDMTQIALAVGANRPRATEG
ncbi:MAG: hypothetical protein M3277_05895 [Actinomycetota bacterium]|nr:hypothetical protein [Actinomycetota bacterium]